MMVTLYMVNIIDKKILFIITKSNWGGAQKYVYELACSVKNKGGVPIVAMGGTGAKNASMGPLSSQLKRQSIKTLSVKNFMRDVSFLKDTYAFFELVKIINTERPDVLHVTSSKAGALGAFAGRICGIKNIIFTSHGLTFDETWRPHHQRFIIKIGTWLTILLTRTSIMISSDTYQKARALPFLKNKVVLIHNGIRPQLLVTKKEARRILAPHMQAPGMFWIGGMGELHANKNWVLLIHAMTLLPKDIYCVIVGEGDQRENLEKEIYRLGLEKRVFLAGYIQAAPLLTAYDIFILPSKKEGLPYVLLEAGLAKCAVVCSRISGNIDIIKHNTNGLLFNNSSHNLAEAILILKKDKAFRKQVGDTLLEDVHTNFSIDTMMKKTIALYQ